MEVTISLATFNEMKEALKIRQDNVRKYCESHVSERMLDRLTAINAAMHEAENVTLIMR